MQENKRAGVAGNMHCGRKLLKTLPYLMVREVHRSCLGVKHSKVFLNGQVGRTTLFR